MSTKIKEVVIVIGALIAKGKVSTAFEALSRQDLDAFLASWADDARLSCPSPMGNGFSDEVSVIEGKEAIGEWFQRFVGQWELTSFMVKNVCVKRLCPLFFSSNTVTAEWDLKLKTRGVAGEADTSGVSVIEISSGKVVEVRVYECAGDPVGQALSPEKSAE